MDLTHHFYSDSELHPLIPQKKVLKSFLSTIWRIGNSALLLPIISAIHRIWNFKYYDEILVFTSIGIAIFIAFYIGRTFSINNEIKQSKAIHEGLHNCRNSIVKIQKILKTNSETPTISELCSYINDATLKVFQARKRKVIGVAIRLSGLDTRHKGTYSTIHRAGNLSLSRQTTHLGKKEGVAKLLLDQNKNGCVIFQNIHKASTSEFVKSSNEDQFKDEVKSMLAVPLCVQEGSGGEMIGILHISSKDENVFNQDDVAIAKALADMAATMLGCKVGLNNSISSTQSSSQQPSSTMGTPIPTPLRIRLVKKRIRRS